MKPFFVLRSCFFVAQRDAENPKLGTTHKEPRTNDMKLPLLAALLLAPLAALHSAESRKPNIILFLIDDQDKASIGAYGGKTFTPNLDRI